jgi:predicted dehydrogenase
MTQQLKTGLIGAGVFAGYHANKLAAHPRIEFMGVHDPDTGRALSLAEKHNVQALTLKALLAACDAVIIASPASYHGNLGCLALEAGCHCLIEKPIATVVESASDITRLSLERNLVVQVGHQERMVLRAIGLDRVSESPLAITAVRSNPYSARGTDTSVTMDLMTHDIDLCTALFGQGPDRVEGNSKPIKSETPDESHATLHYGTATAQLIASRVVEKGERHMTITYPSGEVRIDFNAKSLVHTTPFDLNVDFANDPQARDSLGAATDIFVGAVLDGTPVLVSAKAGLIAVEAAVKIDGGV